MIAGDYRRASTEPQCERQTSRLIKATCRDKDCGCVFRITRSWFTVGVPMSCPVCKGYVCTELDD